MPLADTTPSATSFDLPVQRIEHVEAARLAAGRRLAHDTPSFSFRCFGLQASGTIISASDGPMLVCRAVAGRLPFRIEAAPLRDRILAKLEADQDGIWWTDGRDVHAEQRQPLTRSDGLLDIVACCVAFAVRIRPGLEVLQAVPRA